MWKRLNDTIVNLMLASLLIGWSAWQALNNWLRPAKERPMLKLEGLEREPVTGLMDVCQRIAQSYHDGTTSPYLVPDSLGAVTPNPDGGYSFDFLVKVFVRSECYRVTVTRVVYSKEKPMANATTLDPVLVETLLDDLLDGVIAFAGAIPMAGPFVVAAAKLLKTFADSDAGKELITFLCSHLSGKGYRLSK